MDVVPYDEHLLERSILQWQFGDWESLLKLGEGELAHHPDRGRLALLAASGHMQMGNFEDGREMLRKAREWGCPAGLVLRLLIAGAENVFGRIALLGGDLKSAETRFEASVEYGSPRTDTRLLAQARLGTQLSLVRLANGLTREGDEPLPAGRHMKPRIHGTENDSRS